MRLTTRAWSPPICPAMLPQTSSAATTRTTRDEYAAGPSPPGGGDSAHPVSTGASRASRARNGTVRATPPVAPGRPRDTTGPGDMAAPYMGMVLITRRRPRDADRPDAACTPGSTPQCQSCLEHAAGGHHVLGPGAVALPRHLEDGGDGLQGRVAEQGGQAVRTDGAVTDVLVTVPVGAEVHLRVVEVHATESGHADGGPDQVHQGVGLLHGAARDARGPQVLGVEADTQALVSPRSLDHLGQLLEGAAHGVPLSL